MNFQKRTTPQGTKDLVFGECRLIREVAAGITEAFESRGYSEIMTPGLEYMDVFDGPNSYIKPKSMFKLFDREGNILVMRPDCTVPAARLAGSKLKSAKKPLRLFYNQPIYAQNRKLTGVFDEEIQVGAELVGIPGEKADLEILSLAILALSRLGVETTLELGFSGFFDILCYDLKLDERQRSELLNIIGEKDFEKLDAFLNGFKGKAANAMRELPRLFGGEEILEKARKALEGTTAFRMLAYFEQLVADVKKLKRGGIIIDLGLVQKNRYYTGLIFKGYIGGAPDAILSGGRYDNLYSEFGMDYPAVGFALNLLMAAETLIKQGRMTKDSPADCMVFANEGYYAEGLLLVNELTSKGKKAIFSVFETLEETEKFANQNGIEKVYEV